MTTWNAPAARDKWTLKTSVANGREAFEAPLRVNPNETVEWTVTYTDKPTSLAGVFQDDQGGRAATDYYILVFSADRKYWTPGSRRIRMARPATDGAFSLKGLPPGESHFLAALSDLETGEWNDPALLERLVGSSARVTLRDGETTTQDFRIGGSSMSLTRTASPPSAGPRSRGGRLEGRPAAPRRRQSRKRLNRSLAP